MGHAKHATKQEYNKPQLKEQIDAAMQAFLLAGRAVQHLPTVASAETAVIRPEAPASRDEDA